MAFVRFKGPYAYLVANAREGRGQGSRVAQKVLCYLGRGPDLPAATIAKVKAQFPGVKVDWEAIRRELAAGAQARPAAKSKPKASRRRETPPRKARAAGVKPPPAVPSAPGGDEWSDW